jgi:hypothetical protein
VSPGSDDQVFERACSSLVVQGVLDADPAWAKGPLPWEYAGGRTTASSRASYFNKRVGDTLYGARRWHMLLDTVSDISFPGVRVIGAEALRFSMSLGGVRANTLLIAHLDLPREPDPLNRALLGTSRLGDPEHGVRKLLDGLLGQSGAVCRDARRAFGAVFLTPGLGGLPVADWGSGYGEWSLAERWLWLAASSTPVDQYPPPALAKDTLIGSAAWLSADWRALVLRDGAGFLGERSDLGSADGFFKSAEVYFRSIYLDALLLGQLQQLGLEDLADQLAELDDPASNAARLSEIERAASAFRNVYWWQHAAGHGTANDLLGEYQAQHGLKELASQIVEELNDYARQVQTAAAERNNALLAVITVLGLPVGVALGLAQTLNVHSLGWILCALAIAVVLSVCVFATTPGRALIGPVLPRRLKRQRRRPKPRSTGTYSESPSDPPSS